MPSVAFNYEHWQNRYHWKDGGDEWSAEWGGPDAEWAYGVFPRIAGFLPTGSVLEIAQGFGRWTRYLLPSCTSYLGVDIAERCAAACRERFREHRHAQFATNDGSSLPMVDDDSIDFVFSFDALVHCEYDVIGAYLKEISRVLDADGVAFIHHSNAGAYRVKGVLRDRLNRVGRSAPLPSAIRSRVRAASIQAGITNWDHLRGHSMTAAAFSELSSHAGLSCIGQEVMNWTSPELTDCISVVTRPGSKWDRPPVLAKNRHFQAAASSATAAARVFQF